MSEQILQAEEKESLLQNLSYVNNINRGFKNRYKQKRRQSPIIFEQLPPIIIEELQQTSDTSKNGRASYFEKWPGQMQIHNIPEDSKDTMTIGEKQLQGSKPNTGNSLRKKVALRSLNVNTRRISDREIGIESPSPIARGQNTLQDNISPK